MVLFTAPAGIVDLFLCRSETQHTYDWMFHCAGRGTGRLLPHRRRAAIGCGRPFEVRPRTARSRRTWTARSKSPGRTIRSPSRRERRPPHMLNENTWVRLWGLGQRGTTGIALRRADPAGGHRGRPDRLRDVPVAGRSRRCSPRCRSRGGRRRVRRWASPAQPGGDKRMPSPSPRPTLVPWK